MKNEISRESVFAPSEDVVARDIDGEILLIPIASGIGDMEDELYSLNETGRAIWEQLDGISSLEQIVVRLSKEFNAPLEQIRNDVFGLVTELDKRHMLTHIS